jgi:hypothetical protein
MRALALTVILIVCCCESKANDFWISGGLGVGSRDIAELAGASLQITRHLLVSGRWCKTHALTRYNDDGGFFSSNGFSPSASDYGILLGWITKDSPRKNTLSFSVGVGEVNIVDRGEWLDNWIFADGWDKIERNSSGLLLQGQFFHKDFGVQFFANKNGIDSFGGLVLSWRSLHSF